MQSILGELSFYIGWKTTGNITIFGTKYDITIKARAYDEKDGLTDAQYEAFSEYIANLPKRQVEIERLLKSCCEENTMNRFTPRTLLFDREGGYALLCDDSEAPDEGIAVLLKPEQRVVSQDDFL